MLPVMQPGETFADGLYFLLGLQRFRADSSLRGNRLSLFGGRRCHVGEDGPAIAAREWIEETLGCVGCNAHDAAALKEGRIETLLTHQQRTKVKLATRLRNHHYLFRVRLHYQRKGLARYYDVFVVLVPWAPQAPQRFARVHEMLRQERGGLYERLRRARGTDCVTDAMGHMRACYREMDELTIWSRRQLECAVVNNHTTVHDFLGGALQCRVNLPPILKEVLHILGHLQAPLGTWPCEQEEGSVGAPEDPMAVVPQTHTASTKAALERRMETEVTLMPRLQAST